MEAIVLAGGLGTRLGELTKEIPKPMLPVSGRPFLEILLDYWEAQGVDRFILAVGHRSEVVLSRFGNRYKKADIVYSVEDKLLGTGGGLLAAQEKLKSRSSFLVVNGDTFFEVRLEDLARFHHEKRADCSLAVRKMDGSGRYERVEMDGTCAVRALPGRGGPHAGFAIGGVYLMNPGWEGERISRRGERLSLEPDLIRPLINQNKKFYGFISDGRFIDIGTPEDYERASTILNRERV